MLLKLVVSTREMRVMANVALSAGSSQHGNVRLAAVGLLTGIRGNHDYTINEFTYSELRQGIGLSLSALFPSQLVVAHHITCEFSMESNLELGLRSGRESRGKTERRTLGHSVECAGNWSLLDLQLVRIYRCSTEPKLISVQSDL
jgi:hypothetical protein